MNLTLMLSGEESEGLRQLYVRLSGDESLRGNTRLVTGPPEPGSLGSAFESVVTNLAAGGATVALVNLLVSWIRERHGQFVVKLRRSDGTELSFDAPVVKKFNSDEVQLLIKQLTEWVDGGTPPPNMQEGAPGGPPAVSDGAPIRRRRWWWGGQGGSNR